MYTMLTGTLPFGSKRTRYMNAFLLRFLFLLLSSASSSSSYFSSPSPSPSSFSPPSSSSSFPCSLFFSYSCFLFFFLFLFLFLSFFSPCLSSPCMSFLRDTLERIVRGDWKMHSCLTSLEVALFDRVFDPHALQRATALDLLAFINKRKQLNRQLPWVTWRRVPPLSPETHHHHHSREEEEKNTTSSENENSLEIKF